MRRLTLALLCTLCCSLAVAQPSWTANARKGIVTLHALQQAGDTISSAAFFIDADGTLLAPFKTIQRATTAWAEDEKGTRYDVTRIAGFNSTYDVVKLQVNTNKKKVNQLIISRTQPTEGSTVYLMPAGTEDKVDKVEKAGDYGYYTLTARADATLKGNPLMNDRGEVTAILQTPMLTARAPFYALDIRLATDLGIGAMDVNNTDLAQCSILKQLPADEVQAKSFLYLCQGPLATQTTYADEYIAAYPQSASGYVHKAECLADAGDYAAAQAAYEQGIKAKVKETDELYYSRACAAYNAIVSGTAATGGWTLENALADVRKAYSINPLPLYTMQEARILYAMKDYDAAAEKFTLLTQTNMRSPDLFIYVAQCRENLGADKEELLALNDSAIACFTKPYTAEAANYLWMRASLLSEMERYRDAINDLDDYEHLLSGRLTDQFYYEREQLEAQVRMYAQAINDIQKAIQLNPREPVYYAEQAVLLYRVKDLDEAIKSCRKAIELDSTFPDAHRLLGICLRDKGNTSEARAELQRAVDLGDTLAQGVLDKLQ